MKLLAFSRRTSKEILRDPLNLGFGLGFPVVLLLLMTAIQTNVPVDLFRLETLTPGIAVFGLSFLTLFSATLIAKDRESAFLQRLYTAPLRASDFILGYMLPLLPIALTQSAVCYITAILLGLQPTASIAFAMLAQLPIALFFIALGLLCGSAMGVKQVGGLCGALLTNMTAWLSGAWFDLNLVGGAFRRVAYALPFVHAVEFERALLVGSAVSLSHLGWILAYAAATVILSVAIFLRQMRRA